MLASVWAAGALYYFALAHQADFDVRWCKGPIGTLIFEPFVQKLKSMGVKILGGRRVQEILPAEGSAATARSRLNPAAAAAAFGKTLAGRVVAKGPQGSTETFDADAVVLAAGVPALQQMVRSSRLLGSAPDLAASMGLDCSDVLAVRLWLDRKVQLRTPSNVVAGFDEGVGGTLFQLDDLQVRLAGGVGEGGRGGDSRGRGGPIPADAHRAGYIRDVVAGFNEGVGRHCSNWMNCR